MLDDPILINLASAISKCDGEEAENWARIAVKENVDPMRAVDAVTETIRKIGDGFEKGELWLPELVGAAQAMKIAMPILEEELIKRGLKRDVLGKVVIGTVLGDIHDIGKSMVATMLIAEGFNVNDLGVNVKAEQFVDAVKKNSPDILAMSALLTTTAPEQRKVIEMLEKDNMRKKIKIMVGGGSITEDFSVSIRADGYESDAPGAAKLARKLIGK